MTAITVDELVTGFLPSIEKYLDRMKKAGSYGCRYLKSAAYASNARKLGKSLNCSDSNNIPKALYHFNECIANAPPDSEELALGFAERSTILFLQKKYDLTLLDVNRALQGSLLSDRVLRSTLMKRRLNCWKKLLKERSDQTVSESLDQDYRFLTDLPSDDSPISNDPIWNTKFDNPLLENVSKKVRVEYCAESGRKLIATEDIEPGEVLSIHKFFAVIVTDTKNYCCHCTILCSAMIPCRTCNEEMYCSELCRKLAYDSYHRTECKIFGLVRRVLTCELKLSFFFPIRWFLIGTNQGANLTKLMSDRKIRACLLGESAKCVDEESSLNDYHSLLESMFKTNKMIPNNEQDSKDADDKGTVGSGSISDNTDCTEDKRDSEDHNPLLAMQIDTRSQFLNLPAYLQIFTYLKCINFFGKQKKEQSQSGGKLNNEEVFVCILLLHHEQAIKKMNGIYRIQSMFENEKDRHCIGFGSGGLLNLTNYACDANVQSIASKQRNLSYCLKPIRAGEQIFTDDISCHFRFNNLKTRQKFILKHFSFECRCAACVNDWPQLQDLLRGNKVAEYITTSKQCTCIEQQIKKTCVFLALIRAQGIPETGDDPMTLEKTFELSKTIRLFVKDPSLVLYLIDDNIMTRMWRKGNFYITR